jgi:hypothetical protein
MSRVANAKILYGSHSYRNVLVRNSYTFGVAPRPPRFGFSRHCFRGEITMFGKVPKSGTTEHTPYPRKRHEKGDWALTGAGAKTPLSSRVFTMPLMWPGLDF